MIALDATTIIIDLILVPTPAVQNYITTLIAELGERHQVLSLAHEQL